MRASLAATLKDQWPERNAERSAIVIFGSVFLGDGSRRTSVILFFKQCMSYAVFIVSDLGFARESNEVSVSSTTIYYHW